VADPARADGLEFDVAVAAQQVIVGLHRAGFEAAWWWMLDYNEERPHDALKQPRVPGFLCWLDGGDYVGAAGQGNDRAGYSPE
jgi:hypothetical protein